MIDPRAPDYSKNPVSPLRPIFGYGPSALSGAPGVTIITPFSDVDQSLEQTARSIIQQSFQQWEWIVIARGADAPRARQILDGCCDVDPKVRVIDNLGRLGVAAAKNAGFSAARSNYVVQLRCGDLLEPTALEKWIWFLESYPSLAFVDAYDIHLAGEQRLSPHGFHEGLGFLQRNLTLGTSVIRKTIHNSVGGYDESLPDEMAECEYWLRCATSGWWGGTLREYLNWSQSADDHHLSWTKLSGSDACGCDVHVLLRERYPDLWRNTFPAPDAKSSRLDDPRPDTLPWQNELRKKQPRLLLIVPCLSVGGSEKFCLDLVEQLSGKGWEITIATTLPSDNVWLPQFSRSTPDIFVLENFLHPIDYPRFIRYLISSRDIDCVLVSNSEFGYRIVPYIRAHFPQVALTDVCHVETEYWRDGGYAQMSVAYQELLDLNITSSNHLKEWMIRRGAHADQIEVAHTNVDCDAWTPNPSVREAVRRELGLKDAIPVVLFVGRVCADKQPNVLAQTALRLHQAGLDFVMLVVGGGPDLPWVESFVAANDLGGKVKVLGEVPYGRVEQLMQASDIFFLPSRWEGIAITLFEALACGLPPVAADVGGQQELVTPECGLLISAGDDVEKVRGYSEALASLLRDPDRRVSLGREGRTRVNAHFRLPQMGDRMDQLLSRAIERCAREPRPNLSVAIGSVAAQQAVDRVQLLEWIKQLEEARAWADEQRGRWESTSRDQEDVINELRTWVEDLKQSLAWSEGQRAALERPGCQSAIKDLVVPAKGPLGLGAEGGIQPLLDGRSRLVHRLKRFLTPHP